MNLKTWISYEREALEAFMVYWQDQHGANPELYPLEMEPGQWDEQFHAWAWANNKAGVQVAPPSA